MSAHVRNIAIILVLAALVALLPGGGSASRVVIQAITLLFLASLGWFAMVMYRQHRFSLHGLGDTKRGVLYGAIAVAAVALTATRRLWLTSAGEVVWLLLIAGAVYAVAAVIFSARRY